MVKNMKKKKEEEEKSQQKNTSPRLGLEPTNSFSRVKLGDNVNLTINKLGAQSLSSLNFLKLVTYLGLLILVKVKGRA